MVEELGGGWVDGRKGITKALGLREHPALKKSYCHISQSGVKGI